MGSGLRCMLGWWDRVGRVQSGIRPGPVQLTTAPSHDQRRRQNVLDPAPSGSRSAIRPEDRNAQAGLAEGFSSFRELPLHAGRANSIVESNRMMAPTQRGQRTYSVNGRGRNRVRVFPRSDD